MRERKGNDITQKTQEWNGAQQMQINFQVQWGDSSRESHKVAKSVSICEMITK